MKKNYRIGLDIGIGSVGWAVLENDPATEEPTKILKLGVRTFSPNEVDKTGESTAKNRREKRGLRRRTRRKELRRQRMKALLHRTFNIDLDKELENISNEDVYMLRAKAIKEKVSRGEICKIVLNILKRRGFQSNRKSASSQEGELLKYLNENASFLQNGGYATVGEALYNDPRFKTQQCGKEIYNIRNHSGDYRNCFYRSLLQEEIKQILTKQKEYYPEIDDEFISTVLEIFSAQRTFDQGPGQPSPYTAKFEVGECTFIKGEPRAPKATYTFEYFNALSKINNLKINDESLTEQQVQILVDEVKEKEQLKFSQVRKLLSLPLSDKFNLCRYKAKKGEDLTEEDLIKQSEKANFVSLDKSYSIRKALNLESSYENRDLIDEVATMLTYNKSEQNIDEFISKSDLLKKLTPEQIDSIKELNFDKFGSLSIIAMKKMIPYLEKGERYDIAARSAGFNHSSFETEKKKYLKGEEIDEMLKDITSPVVKRAVHQSLRIINAIIKEYGSPQQVNIELAREMSKDFNDRRKMQKRQEENLLKNDQAREGLREFGLVKPTYLDLLKYKLYNEQNGKSMYSGNTIDFNRLFEPNYVQIDHILPFSRSMDDSFNNKVLVLSAENQNKGNKTPYEYLSDDEKAWADFVGRVSLLKNRDKEERLLKTKFGEEQQKNFIERNLNDTRYISRFLLNLMQKYLQVQPSNLDKKNVIRSVNGSVTNYLRKFWGINKIRDDGDIHHCVDAAVISTVSNREIQKITTFNMLKEKFVFDDKNNVFISKKTGEVLSKEDKEKIEKQGIDLMSDRLPPPYFGFVKELEIRGKVDYYHNTFTQEDKDELVKLGYTDQEADEARPVFISRMKNTKTTGAIHKETMMSDREYETTKNLIKSVSISELKVCDAPETVELKDDKYPDRSIENYYRPESDRLLYLKLKNHLIEKGNISAQEEFRKPRKDGSDGPIVNKVKVYVKKSNIVRTPIGAAENANMVRVDVFKKDNKFYLCPIYMSDYYAKKLPNKVIEIGKEWSEIDDTYEFLFSLYQNDLIKVTFKSNKDFAKNFKNPLSKKPDKISVKEQLVYYNGTGIATASIGVLTNDRCYTIYNLGVKTLVNIEKYYVDIMGNIYKAPKEERKSL